MTASATSILGAWVATVPTDHGEAAYGRADAALIDTIACMVAGKDSDPARLAREVVAPWGTGRSSVVGGGVSAAPWAALVNGAAAHALDFDDNDTPSAGHPSAVLIPCLLALGDERRASGQAVLDAYIVGLEVIARVGEAVNMSHYLRGWHATATLGVLGAAAAAARLLGLDATRAATAISLATSMSAGFQSQFGTMAKPLHAGLAAKSGLLAASLAEAGMSASPRTLDGPVGLGALMSSSPNGFAGLEKRLGRPLAILEYGLCVKWHPCCYYAARSLDAILDLKREHPVNEHVKEILIRIPARNARIVAIERPATPDEARFSLRYCVAATVIHGELRAADFTVERVRSVDIESLMRRIRIESYDSDPAAADLSATDPDTVTIRFEDGSVAARSVAYPKGHARAPLSDAELMQKLAACTESMGAAQRRELRAALLSFRIQPRIDSLTRLLRSAPSAASTKG